MTTFKPLTQHLSVVHIGAEARTLNERFDSDGRELYEIALPQPDYQAVDDHASDLIEAACTTAGVESWDELQPDQQEAVLIQFADSDGYTEWASGFDPMMSFYWPVTPAYKIDLDKAVALMARFAPATTLIEFVNEDDGRYGIGLNGGGMDLTDHIVIAYLALGCIPPQALLSRVLGVISDRSLVEVGDALLDAHMQAVKYLRWTTDDLEASAGRLSTKLTRATENA